jgi:hypothetical protein
MTSTGAMVTRVPRVTAAPKSVVKIDALISSITLIEPALPATTQFAHREAN